MCSGESESDWILDLATNGVERPGPSSIANESLRRKAEVLVMLVLQVFDAPVELLSTVQAEARTHLACARLSRVCPGGICVRQWMCNGPGRPPTIKIHLNRFSIWMEGDKPCCSPGSSEEKVAEVLDFIRVADEWISAVQEQQAAQRKAQLVSK